MSNTNEFAAVLEQQLSVLSQNFFQELRKIVEQRQKLETECLSFAGTDSSDRGASNIREMKSSRPKPFTVRLESSLGEKLAKSRGTADELEDKLQETRIAFKDKLKTVEQMKTELDRRENILVQSVQEIEAYIRAVFHMKHDADDMFAQLVAISEEQSALLKELENNYRIGGTKKEVILNGINAFQSAKIFLKKKLSDLPEYSSIQDLVEYYLVLETLQEDLLYQDAKSAEAQEALTIDQQNVEEYKRCFPMTVFSKQRTILELKFQLKNLKNEIAQLEEQIDMTVFSKLKDDATWYDFQRWIQNLFLTSSGIRAAELDDATPSTLNMLDQLKDFTEDALEMAKRFKKKE